VIGDEAVVVEGLDSQRTIHCSPTSSPSCGLPTMT
jgi:hypothetical protein